MISVYLLTAILAWGVFSFGAVYRWAHTPLAIACAVAGACGLLLRRRDVATERDIRLGAALALPVAAVLVQLVPLPRALVAWVSPATNAFLSQYDAGYRAGIGGTHALSLDPARTLVGLALLGAFALFTLGAAQWLTARDVRRLAPAVAVLGVLLSCVAFAQMAVPSGRIYGFWQPLYGEGGFGPFVNRNHFAGWMLMALPLVLGCLAGHVSNAMRGVGRDRHARFIWLASREANTMMLLAMAVAVMGLALVMTLSRSGIVCFAVALALTAAVVARRFRTVPRRATLLAFLVLVALLSGAWAGLDRIAARFASVNADWAGRRTAWQDTTRIIGDFPLAGTGLDTYGVAMIRYQSQEGDHFFEAHNDYLQLAAEGGALLVVPALVVVVVFAGTVRRRFRSAEPAGMTWWIRVGAATGLVAVALQETVEFSLQMPGNAALFALLAGIAAGGLPHRY